MQKYATIKQLVIDETMSKGEFPSLEILTSLVKEHFPNSKWQKSHYDWYKSQIKTRKIDLEEFLKAPDPEANDAEVRQESITEFSISVEQDLQNYLANRLHELETGLTLEATEFGTPVGFIDILAKDRSGTYVVVELKAGKAKDAAFGQILGYMGALRE